eukprot:CAMPEP_0184534580 /NCGR_PEP_ID=MMETSP0198_2-20121128/15412_1 /TAXON_ID=1112570 /ORGANISM="Thraustochytrium sp., Strain LLF1b" /LENGTH=166 /DNA_ID=CAMNT_0026927525 /DNA_START=51 /DNA_END=548 /DNA_ORIENTATION=-
MAAANDPPRALPRAEVDSLFSSVPAAILGAEVGEVDVSSFDGEAVGVIGSIPGKGELVGDLVVGEFVGDLVVGKFVGDLVVGEFVGDFVTAFVGDFVTAGVGLPVSVALPQRSKPVRSPFRSKYEHGARARAPLKDGLQYFFLSGFSSQEALMVKVRSRDLCGTAT